MEIDALAVAYGFTYIDVSLFPLTVTLLLLMLRVRSVLIVWLGVVLDAG